MYEDISLETILMNDSVGFVLGVPHALEALTGTIDGTNKKFTFANPPLFPRSCLGIIAQPQDVDVYGVKTNVNTKLTVSKIDEVIDAATGDSIDGAIELDTAPAAASADSIVGNYVEELEPFVAQDVTPTVKQTTKTVGRLRSTDQMYGYGTIDVQIKSNQVMGNDSIKQIQKLMYDPYTPDVGLTVQTGYDVHEMVPKPKVLYGYIPFELDDEVLGRFYFKQCRLSPIIPGGKANDNATYALDMSVQKKPLLLLPKEN
jgi:hypothetical protein